MGFYVGAYAASPNTSGWNAEAETDYYNCLKAMTNVEGLEHPFTGSLHPVDDDWFLANISPNWHYVFTCVPGIMNALSNNPHFGLASTNEVGRQEALAFMKKACAAITKLNTHCNKQVVKCIQLQTAPNRSKGESSAAKLATSLQELLTWDWHGAKLVIEHCDAFKDSHAPSKGFLSLEDEIEVVNNINKNTKYPMGIVVNWGRSVIETRSTQGALEHINLLKQHDLLSGLMFSGVSDKDTEYGKWQDSHMPPAPDETILMGASGSLMTQHEMRRCLQASALNARDPDVIVGLKIGIRPKDTSLEDRIKYIRYALAALQDA